MILIFARRALGDNSLWDYCVGGGWDDIEVVGDADVLMRLVRSIELGVVLCANFNGLGRSVSQLVALLREFVAHQTV